MKYRTRIYYSAEQRAEIWDRWQRGESMRSIGRVFDGFARRCAAAFLKRPFMKFVGCLKSRLEHAREL